MNKRGSGVNILRTQQTQALEQKADGTRNTQAMLQAILACSSQKNDCDSDSELDQLDIDLLVNP